MSSRMCIESTPGASTLETLVALAATAGASDLHLAPGCAPLVRIDCSLCPVDPTALSDADVDAVAARLLRGDHRQILESDGAADIAAELAGLPRLRAHVLRRRGRLSICLRLIPNDPPPLESLGLPTAAQSLAAVPHGLVLVAGATGSGKSTTLAALVRALLRERPAHVLTVEDPVEFLHHNGCGLVTQRELGADVPSFSGALRQALREDPDVVLIGEMRDTDTIRAALTLAETGHLVLSTIHSHSAIVAVRRVVDAFPDGERSAVRSQLAEVLQAVLVQALLPARGGRGRHLAAELLMATGAVRTLIRDDKIHQLAAQMEAGQGATGMQTMAQSVLRLWRSGRVDERVAKPWLSASGGALR